MCVVYPLHDPAPHRGDGLQKFSTSTENVKIDQSCIEQCVCEREVLLATGHELGHDEIMRIEAQGFAGRRLRISEANKPIPPT